MNKFNRAALRSLLSLGVPLLVIVSCSAPNGTGPTEDHEPGPHYLVDLELRSGIAGEMSTPLTEGVSVSLSYPGRHQIYATGERIAEIPGGFRVEHRFERLDGAPTELLLTMEANGHAPSYVLVPPVTDIEPLVPVVVRATLYPTEQFEVANLFKMSMADSRISVTLPPDSATAGKARLFHPLLDAAGMPGALMDSRGRLLGSGILSSVTFSDDRGRPVSEAGEQTVLRMQIPKELWSSLVAIEPGDHFIEPGDHFIEPGDHFIEPGDHFRDPLTDAINVAVYGFLPASGAWSYSSVGQLERSSGAPIEKHEMDSIWQGAFEEDVFVAAQVDHFSHWGLAWPVQRETCIGGLLEDVDGLIGSGMTVVARGIDVAFASRPIVADEAGLFCLPVPLPRDRAEYRIRLSIPRMGVTEELEPIFSTYDWEVVTVTSDSKPGGCEASCENVELPLIDPGVFAGSRLPSPNGDVILETCSLGVAITHYDPNVDPASVQMAVSGRLIGAPESVVDACREKCVLASTEHEGGLFELAIPPGVETEITGTWRFEKEGFVVERMGSARVFDCGADAVRLEMSEGRIDAVLEPYIEDQGQGVMLYWSVPHYGIEVISADFVQVTSESGVIKWALGFEGGSRPTEVEYGKAEGGFQIHPADGSLPEALELGDTIMVWASGQADGLDVTASGSHVFGAGE